MTKLEDISLSELHEILEEVSEKKPTQRLMVAILYKQGPSVPMIADWFDMRERTIYDWFDRMEEDPIEDAIYDNPRPGRPPKLTDEQLAIFKSALEDDPIEYGLDASEWSPPAARTFLQDRFNVDYSRRHVQRLLNDGAHSRTTSHQRHRRR